MVSIIMHLLYAHTTHRYIQSDHHGAGAVLHVPPSQEHFQQRFARLPVDSSLSPLLNAGEVIGFTAAYALFFERFDLLPCWLLLVGLSLCALPLQVWSIVHDSGSDAYASGWRPAGGWLT